MLLLLVGLAGLADAQDCPPRAQFVLQAQRGRLDPQARECLPSSDYRALLEAMQSGDFSEFSATEPGERSPAPEAEPAPPTLALLLDGAVADCPGDCSGGAVSETPYGLYRGLHTEGAATGVGVFRYADGSEFYGRVVRGRPDGPGVRVDEQGRVLGHKAEAHSQGKEVLVPLISALTALVDAHSGDFGHLSTGEVVRLGFGAFDPKGARLLVELPVPATFGLVPDVAGSSHGSCFHRRPCPAAFADVELDNAEALQVLTSAIYATLARGAQAARCELPGDDWLVCGATWADGEPVFVNLRSGLTMARLEVGRVRHENVDWFPPDP